MKISDFLENIREEPANFVYCFVSEQYPLLFFRFLFDLFQSDMIFPFKFRKLSICSKTKSHFYSSLQQTFLGENNFYWFGDLSQFLGSKKNSDILKFLNRYYGPHLVSFFLSDEIRSKLKIPRNTKVVEIENDINKRDFFNLLNLFGIEFSSSKMDVISKDMFYDIKYSLDESCMLIEYLRVLNIRLVENKNYLNLIFHSSNSLYELADLFFSLNEAAFFSLWREICENYQDMFWIAFWSKQIFKAYYVIRFLNSGDFSKARKMSFGLPYNFIKRDYKHFCLKQLADYYDFLFNIDFAIKNGSKFCSLDLFYLNHFVR